jgi:hypothetical protein
MRNLETDVQRKRCSAGKYELTRAAITVAPFVPRLCASSFFRRCWLVRCRWALAHDDAHEYGREVADWTRITVQATLTPPVTSPPVSTRTAAMVKAAVFDAVNGIERRYNPIFVRQLGLHAALPLHEMWEDER